MNKTGLVLSGGGARAAYQVGVLQAVAEILPKGTRQPFPVITGTSAGAINALGLAGRPGTFRYRARALGTMWASLVSESIYRTDALAVARNAADIAWAMLRSGHASERSLALLDNQPLRELLDDVIQFTHVERAIAGGELEAIGIIAANYSSGLSTTFYQGQAHIAPWQRIRRRSVPCTLGVEHMMASSALPTLFPATRIGKHYFGDGALRQTRPLSSAIHLGADRLFIIGVSENMGGHGKNYPAESSEIVPPTISQVLGQMLNAVFLDSIDTDLETLSRFNALLDKVSIRDLESTGLARFRRIDTLAISPSQSLAEIAREYIHEVPGTMRWFLRKTGSIKESGSGGALSYILFEPGYTQRLMELGYTDAIAQMDSIRSFFDMETDQDKSGRRRSMRYDGPVVRTPPGRIKRFWLDLTGQHQRRI